LELDVITYERFDGPSPALSTLLKEAAEDKFLGNIVYERMSDKIILFKEGPTLIGFAMPRLENGYYRVGPIFVTEARQGKGVARDFLKSFFVARSGRAYIEPDNIASRKSFEAAGFRYTGKVYVKGPDRYLQYEKFVSKSLSW
jgi:RimJ/RimL family protein N-acetyltransferase